MIGEDVVKDGVNLAGIYVRRRERPDGEVYHSIEMDIDDLGQLIGPIVADFKKARKYWYVSIGNQVYNRD